MTVVEPEVKRPNAKLTQQDVRIIRWMHTEGITRQIIAKRYTVSRQQVSRIISGQHWTTIQERFEDFHSRHPEVYEAVVRFARQVQRKGFTRFGVKAIWERTRWYLTIEQDFDEYKLNNNFHSRYARLIMQQESDLEGFFETRELRAE